MLRLLQGLLGQEPLSLDLDIQGLRDIRHDDVNHAAHAKDDVLKGTGHLRHVLYRRSEQGVTELIPPPRIEYLSGALRASLNIEVTSNLKMRGLNCTKNGSSSTKMTDCGPRLGQVSRTYLGAESSNVGDPATILVSATLVFLHDILHFGAR